MAARTPVDPRNDFLPVDEDCRALVARVCASAEFQRAARLRAFLQYVVDRKLAGAPHDITEVVIGHRVFGRSEAYNTGDDSIVRTEARTLRQRLEKYFEGEGASEPILLEIPRGGYAPVFRPRFVVESLAGNSAPAPRPTLTRRLWIGAGAATALAAVGGWRWASAAKSNAEAAGSGGAPAAMGPVRFDSSDARLNQAFERSKRQALGCVFSGDPVGDWYATLAGGASRVFCMRDVSHQATGAAVLGLTRHTRNMLRRFAASVARSREWCGYWVISKDGFPPSDTYHDDSDFGYSLPANFDVLGAAHRQYLWTGDAAYLDAVFSNFYDRTVTNYVENWDRDHDGIMENSRRPRILPTYHHGSSVLTGADLVAAQYYGYLAYAEFQDLKGIPGSLSQRVAQEYRAKAAALRTRFNSEWWDAANNRFYTALLPTGAFEPEYEGGTNSHLLAFGIPEDGAKAEGALAVLQRRPPESPQPHSYLPDIFYQYGWNEAGFDALLTVADIASRQSVTEPAFAVVGTLATGMMGIAPDAPRRLIETWPRLPKSLAWARISRVPVLGGEISVEHRGGSETAFTNHSPVAIQWKATFGQPGGQSSSKSAAIKVDGATANIETGMRQNRVAVLSTTIAVRPGETRRAVRID